MKVLTSHPGHNLGTLWQMDCWRSSAVLSESKKVEGMLSIIKIYYMLRKG